jgi:hypothetical protein
MIRVVWLLRRRAGMSTDEFTARWRDEHGPRIASLQSRLDMLRYVQTHRDTHSAAAEASASDKRGGLDHPYDGVEEYWFESESALVATRSNSDALRAEAEVTAALAGFVDCAASPLWLAHEYPQINTQRERVVARTKSGIIKVHFPLRARSPMSAVEAQYYWRTAHGPLVRSHAIARGTLCYLQVHRSESPLAEELRVARGAANSDYIGHAEAWFDRLVPRSGPEAAAAEAAAIADEARFIDWPRSSFMIGKELVFVDRDWR